MPPFPCTYFNDALPLSPPPLSNLQRQSNPILESVGNAKTVYNNNSSRFGKYMVVNFNSQGIIEGGKIIDYLLEKNRVVRQNPGERTFHIFYNVVVGGIDPKYQLQSDPAAYRFTSQSGVTVSEGIDDVADWQLILKAFDELNFSADDRHWAISVLACIIHLGEVKFTQAGGAQVVNTDIVEIVAEMLQLDSTALSEGFTEKKRLLRGEVITTPLELAQAEDSRDSFCMKLYQTLFKWICAKINKSLKGAETFHSIGILDIFGFENFQENFLEQFNINYANEKLQQYFNRHIFSLEQIEYAKEGLEWKDIDYVDNAECLDLIERKLGVISLIDEEARLPRGTDDSVKNKLFTNHGKAPHFIKPRVQARTGAGQFGIVHYAGNVMYEADGIVEKNRDSFRDDLLEVRVTDNTLVTPCWWWWCVCARVRVHARVCASEFWWLTLEGAFYYPIHAVRYYCVLMPSSLTFFYSIYFFHRC